MDFDNVLCDDFVSKVRLSKINENNVDKTLISSQPIDVDIDNFITLPNGRIRFISKEVQFNCFFYKGQRKLLVFFPSARGTLGKKLRPLPHFNRWSYYKFTGYSVLCVEDPMYYDYPALGLGWMWGNNEKNYRELFARVVHKVVEYLSLELNQVVFLGSSGGGAPAIHTAAIYGSGVAIAINSQLNFEFETKNSKLKQFTMCTGIDVRAEDPFLRNKLDLIMRSAKNVKFLLVTNLSSDWDRVDHFRYIVEKFNLKPIYGLSFFENIFFWSYYTDNKYLNSHSSQEDHSLFLALDSVAENLNASNLKINDIAKFVSLVNNFWYDKYKVMESYLSLKDEFTNKMTMTARIDLVNITPLSAITNTLDSYIYCSDSNSRIQAPKWLKTDTFQGYVIESDLGFLEIKFRILKNTKITIRLRGIDKKENGLRVPVWVDYSFLSVNNAIIINSLKSVCHSASYSKSFEFPKDSDCVIHVAWKPHFEKTT